MNNLENKKIIVTGASGGIGNSIIEKLSLSGANILASGTKIEKLEQLKSKFKNVKILQFDISQDFSDTTGVDDETDFKMSLKYPPSENKPNLQDGFISNVAFEKANMRDKLIEKVRRDNNLTVEIQGAVILTKK